MENNEENSSTPEAVATTPAPMATASGFPAATFTAVTAPTNLNGTQVPATITTIEVKADHPALAVVARLRDKANSLGSFVVTEFEALLAEIESHLQ